MASGFRITCYVATLVLAASTTLSQSQSTTSTTGTSSSSAVQTAQSLLNVGDYFRPSGTDVSGFPGTSTPFRRSPCPALNTLANHGYLPRNGQNITHQMLKDGIMGIYNIGANVAELLVSQVAELLSLDLLGVHDVIEHDASLVHADTSYGQDPSLVDAALANDLLARADQQGRLGLHEVAAVRKQRTNACLVNNSKCNVGLKTQGIAQGESALLLLALGGDNGDESISKAHAESFLVQEKIPADYKKPATSVNSVQLLSTTGKLTALAIF